MPFPDNLDLFPDLASNTTIKAETVNTYQTGIVKCQSELSSLVNRSLAPTKVMTGLCWKVHVTCAPLIDPIGYGEHDGRAENTIPRAQYSINSVQRDDDILYRYHRPREPFDIDNRRHSTLGSYMPPYSFATLPIPLTAILPNSQPFHSNNKVFITFESLKDTLTVKPNYYNPWSIDNFEGANRNVGGFFSREGLLYHDGATDYSPKVVLADWFPSTENWEGKDKRGEYFTVLVHMVIVG
jgi:hypothetical protein